MRKQTAFILAMAIILAVIPLVFAQDKNTKGADIPLPEQPIQTGETSPQTSCVFNAGAKCGQCGRGSIQCDGSCSGDYTTCDGRSAGFVGWYSASESCGTCTVGVISRHCDGCNVDQTSCSGSNTGQCTPGYGESQACGTNNLGTQTRTCISSCTWGQWSGCVMPSSSKPSGPAPSLFPRYSPSFSERTQPIVRTREFGNHPTGTDTFNIGQGAVARRIVVSAIWRWEDGGSHHTSRAGYPKPSWEGGTGLPMCFSNILPDGYACRAGYNIPTSPSSWTAEFGCPDGTCPIKIDPDATGLFLFAQKDDGGSGGTAPQECQPFIQSQGINDPHDHDYCFGINSYSFNNGVVTLNWYGVTNRDIETKTKIMIVADAAEEIPIPPTPAFFCPSEQSSKCGICGRGTLQCDGSCAGDYSRCSPQPETITTYADTSNQCGRCGTERLQCDGCNVASVLCLGEIQGGCYPQTVQSELCNLGTRQGYRIRTCGSTCSWSQFGDCILYPELCVPGSTRPCTIGSATGTQTCRSDKSWGECINAPDLVIPPSLLRIGGSDGGSSRIPNRHFPFQITTSNIGSGSVPSSQTISVRYTVTDGSRTIIPDSFYSISGGINAGSSHQDSITLRIPAGSFTLTICADHDNRVIETNEENNCVQSNVDAQEASTAIITPPPGGDDGGTLCTNINRDCRAYTREQFELIHQNYYSRGLTTYQSSISQQIQGNNRYACPLSASDNSCCPNPNSCVYNGQCYPDRYKADIDNDGIREVCIASSPGQWADDFEINCADGRDDDGDNLIDCQDADCNGALSGFVRNQDSQPISQADVLAKEGLTTAGTSISNNAGLYNISTIKCGTFNLIASHPDYAAGIVTGVVVNPRGESSADISMILGSLCESDCTLAADDIVHASCDGVNGCSFYDSISRAACDNSQPGWIRDYNASHHVTCASGAPQPKVEIQSSVSCSSGTLVKMTRIVMYNGRPVRMVVAACG